MATIQDRQKQISDGGRLEGATRTMRRDRVNELYYGKIFTPAIQEECRRRIDWIVQNSWHSQNVVDLGCSQGITCLLLGQRGLRVTGVDSDQEAIGWANKELDLLPPRIAERVRFIHADFFDLQPDHLQSDTVVLSEVIEHFKEPERVILHALRFVRPDGRIVITTPFGHKPSEEHRSTFTIRTLLEKIPDTVEIVEAFVADSFIRLIGIKRNQGSQRRPNPENLLNATESGLFEIQRILWDVIKLQGKRARWVAEKSERLQQQLVDTERLAAMRLRASDELEHALAEAKALGAGRLQAVQARLGSVQAQLAGAERQTGVLKHQLLQSKRQLAEARAEFEQIRQSAEYRLSSVLVRIRRLPKKISRRPRKIWRRLAGPRPDVTSVTETLPRPSRPGLKLRAAAILDEFTYECFKHEFDIVLLPRTDWRSEIERGGFDFLFVESAWRGNGGKWNYVMSQFARHGQDLRELVNCCRERGIKTLFWNKEDPVNFDLFIDTARLFDWIFTVDRGCIERYRRALGHDRIVCLPFAAQPAIHNPLGSRRHRPGRVCFAGSRRGDKYENRNRQLSVLLQPALELGVLQIYDRYANDRNPGLRFPEPYARAVVGALPYLQLVEKYRTCDAFLNVNSVEDSPSMLSRRVFEVLACGTPVISTPSVAIEQMLGETVLIARSAEQSRQHIQLMINDHEARDRLGQLGLRKVLSEHTYERRADTIRKTLAFPAVQRNPRLVSVICSTKRPAMLKHAISNVERQTYRHLEIVFVLNSEDFDLDQVAEQLKHFNSFKLLAAPTAGCLGECLNLGLAAAAGDLFAKLDDDDWYGPGYLEDLVLAQDLSMAPVVGKGSYYCYLEELDLTALRFPRHEFEFSHHVHGSTILADRKATEAIAFEQVTQGTDTRFLKAVQRQGMAIFSADRFNFIHTRRASLADHTWKISTAEFFRHCDPLREGLALDQIFV